MTSPLDTLIDELKAPVSVGSCQLTWALHCTSRVNNRMHVLLHLSNTAAHLRHGWVTTRSPCAGRSVAAQPVARCDLLQPHCDPASQHARERRHAWKH